MSVLFAVSAATWGDLLVPVFAASVGVIFGLVSYRARGYR